MNFETILAPIKINGVSQYNSNENVISIPGTDWSQRMVEEFHVFEVPNSGKDIIRYKPEYLTFRKREYGAMDNLHSIEKLIILNFKEDYDLFLRDKDFCPTYRERIRKYVSYLLYTGVWAELPDDEKLVFFFSPEQIELKNSPIPFRNSMHNKYYELNKLLSNFVV
ncbi:MAG: hypothetical protein KDC79_12635 [Cyclobacteriaceae bacterium]|nr:hypothetical protein [Cyclobacteriaceae bacterium]